MCWLQEEEDSEIYSCLQDLQDKREDLTSKIADLELHGDARTAQQYRQELMETEDSIVRKSRERQHRKWVHTVCHYTVTLVLYFVSENIRQNNLEIQLSTDESNVFSNTNNSVFQRDIFVPIRILLILIKVLMSF